MDELPQEQWLSVVMNDHRFTDADYMVNIACEITGDVVGEDYNRVYKSLCALSFPELMKQYGTPCMDDDDVRWLISKGWRDATVKEYMTAECFRYVRMLIEDGFVSFRDDQAVILGSMYDYPNAAKWRESA